jgi:hypothetical protein
MIRKPPKNLKASELFQDERFDEAFEKYRLLADKA